MVVVSLVAVLSSLALPALGSAWLKRSLQSQVEALAGDLRLARSEAIKRAVVVAVCSSSDGVRCSEAPAWHAGWLVFVDANGDRQRSDGEALIRVQQALPRLVSIASASAQNDKRIFSYHPTGWAKAASQTWVFTPQSASVSPRVLCISAQGRPHVRPEGVLQCS